MNPLDLLTGPLGALLDLLHDNAGLTYGWAIVVLTVIVRTLLLPLVVKQYASMRRMQEVAPALKELQRKHKGNRQKLNEELMKFYRENEVNPFSSCLPLAAQLPVFIALYYVLKDFEFGDGTDRSFMWVIPDISLELTQIGWGAAVVVAIYGLSQLLSTELSATPNMPDVQRKVFRVLPVVVVIFVFQFPVPSGLVLYWMTTNVWTAGQQLVMRHKIGLHISETAKDTQAQPKQRGSKTPPREKVAAGVASDGEGTKAGRRRDGGGGDGDDGDAGDEGVSALEPRDAPEAREAPEPRDAPETTAPSTPGARERAGASAGAGGGGGGRRQPRPRGGSRPAASGPTRPAKRKR